MVYNAQNASNGRKQRNTQPPPYLQHDETQVNPQLSKSHAWHKSSFDLSKHHERFMHSQVPNMNSSHRPSGHALRKPSPLHQNLHDHNPSQAKMQRVGPGYMSDEQFQQANFNMPFPAGFTQTGQGYPQMPFIPQVGHAPPIPKGWNEPPQPTYKHGAPHYAFDRHFTSAQSNRVPVSASSLQWIRPKTPHESKAPPKTDVLVRDESNTTASTVAPPWFHGESAQVTPSLALMSSATRSQPTPSQPAKEFTYMDFGNKRKTSWSVPSLDPANPIIGFVPDPSEPIYVCEDLEEHYLKFQPEELRVEESAWTPGRYLQTVLPANTELADQEWLSSEKFLEPQKDPSVYSRTTNLEEYWGTIRNTSYWPDMANDPVFRDLSQDHEIIPFSDLHGDYEPTLPTKTPAHVSAQPSTNEGTSKPASTVNDGHSAENGSVAMELCSQSISEPTPSMRSSPSKARPSEVQTTGGARAQSVGDESPYSPPPVVPVALPIAKTEEHISLAGHQFPEVAMHAAIESVEPMRPPSQHSTGYHSRPTTSSGRSYSAGSWKQLSSPAPQEPQTPTGFSDRPKSFTTTHPLSLKPRQYQVDQNQEDILAKLGVTGGPKPVVDVPRPARTVTPHDQHHSKAHSRSQDGTPAKFSQNGFASHHLPLMPQVPPPPPPRHARNASPLSDDPWQAFFDRDGPRRSPRSDTSHRTLAGSDFGPPVTEAKEDLPMVDSHEANSGAGAAAVSDAKVSKSQTSAEKKDVTMLDSDVLNQQTSAEKKDVSMSDAEAVKPQTSLGKKNVNTQGSVLKPSDVKASMPKFDPNAALADYRMSQQGAKSFSGSIPQSQQRFNNSLLRHQSQKKEPKSSVATGGIRKNVATPNKMDISKRMEAAKKVDAVSSLVAPKKMGASKKLEAPKQAEAPKKMETLVKMETPKESEALKKTEASQTANASRRVESARKMESPKKVETPKQMAAIKIPEASKAIEVPTQKKDVMKTIVASEAVEAPNQVGRAKKAESAKAIEVPEKEGLQQMTTSKTVEAPKKVGRPKKVGSAKGVEAPMKQADEKVGTFEDIEAATRPETAKKVKFTKGVQPQKKQSIKKVETNEVVEAPSKIATGKKIKSAKEVEAPKKQTIKNVETSEVKEVPKTVGSATKLASSKQNETQKNGGTSRAPDSSQQQPKKTIIKLNLSKASAKTPRPSSPVRENHEESSAKKQSSASKKRARSDIEDSLSDDVDEPMKTTDLYAGRLRKRVVKTNPYARIR